MINIHKFAFCTLLLLSAHQVSAANIDFQTIHNNAANDCASIQKTERSNNQNESLPLQPLANEDPCKNVQADKNYIEPKFSTKRPRGQ